MARHKFILDLDIECDDPMDVLKDLSENWEDHEVMHTTLTGQDYSVLVAMIEHEGEVEEDVQGD